jgi:TolB-like protein/tetratricopeptide (TPR) repeat protein
MTEMPSLIPGFEYDVFISYRQKDNKGDKWVSEFVDALKIELESTFKEEISVYFDINPHNGLLETHDVDASLKEKLKCLVFIPIVSRTYCDPRSFAWEHEFKVFIEQASRDKFGLKIKLPDGNIAKRALPVRIHDLDNDDVKNCEALLGGGLRGVEFIYKEPGVNRPMTKLDNEEKNLCGTKYRNQINRVANAINEIISGMRSESADYKSTPSQLFSTSEAPVLLEKSIIVLPFENISPDPDQEYFSDGLTDEIISDLTQIPNLRVISRSSAMTFKGSRNTIKEIAGKVNVRYVLEGSVRKSTDNLRISAQLIDSVNDSHIWAKKYSGTLEDVFDIQEKVSESIVTALKIKLSSTNIKKIQERPIDNILAYDCYRRAYPRIMSYNVDNIELGLKLLQKGIDIGGENALIYAGMAFAYFQFVNAGIDREENIKKAEVFVQKAFNMNNELAEAHFVMALINSLSAKPDKAIDNIIKANACKPGDAEIMIWLALAYTFIGRSNAAKSIINECVRIDPFNPMLDSLIGRNHFYNGRFDLAVEPLVAAYNLNPESEMNKFWKALILFYNNRAGEAYKFINKYTNEPARDSWTHLSILLKYVIKGKRDKLLLTMSHDFVRIHQLDPQSSYLVSALYSFLGEKEESLKWLEISVGGGFINYPFINEFDPLLENIRGDERFRKLMQRVKQNWESYEVYCNIDIIK